MTRSFRNGRYANVTATMALVVALGGTGYAASTVRSKDIKNGDVRWQDLATGSVTSMKVRDGTLIAKDFKPGTLKQGPAGPAGPAGTTGAAGAAGSARAYATVATVDTGPVFVAGVASGFTSVGRPTGVNTGVYCLTPAPGVNVLNAAPIASPEWTRSSATDLLVEPLTEVQDCPAATLEVRTYRFAGRTQPALSNSAAFSVLLP